VAFRGWPSEALEFYEGLEADNSRTYWTAHKAVYDKQVYAPMADLLSELEPEFGPGKIFRPNRDVRFSADKSPYKTAIAARLERGGYIQLSAQGLAAGCGRYMMAADQLDRYRQAVAAPAAGERLARIAGELRAQRIDVHGHDVLRTAPKGYPKDHPRIELLRYKGIVAWRDWPAAAWLGTAAARKRVTEFLHAAQPLNDWLGEHVGDTVTS
jgi:uncharacterized protein (TIGR02453 family)